MSPSQPTIWGSLSVCRLLTFCVFIRQPVVLVVVELKHRVQATALLLPEVTVQLLTLLAVTQLELVVSPQTGTTSISRPGDNSEMFYLTRHVSKNKFLFTMTAYPGQTWTTLGQLCPALWDSRLRPVVIQPGNQTRICSDTSSTEMQCLRPLRHSGAHSLDKCEQ